MIPGLDSLSSLLLTLIALSGEYPTGQIGRLPSTDAYRDKIIKSLKARGLIRTYYRDGLRGLRLTAAAKKLLAERQPDRFTPLFVGDTVTNAPKYTPAHRLRMHRMAEVLTTMFNADVSVFPWANPDIFTPSPLPAAPNIEHPVYYPSREVKNIGLMSNKIRNSRSAGLLLTGDSIFAVYNTGSGRIKWENQAEMRLAAMLKIELCQKRLPGQYINANQSGIMFGSTMEQMVSLLVSNIQNGSRFMQDGSSFDPFYFLTSDHRGEVILRLLCDPDKRAVLDGILTQGLSAPCPGFVVENDAMDGDEPVLFTYTCDMPRIKRFDNALHIHDMRGTLYCFDFQEAALRELCGPNVSIQCIDFETYERGVFHQPQRFD